MRIRYLLRGKINWHRKKPFPPKDFAGIERLVGELAKAVGAVSFVQIEKEMGANGKEEMK